MSDSGEFRYWEDYYERHAAEAMPWYCEKLDPDLSAELRKRGLNHGKFLDIGTGAGTQAIELAKLGFEVTATDLSAAALAQARQHSSAVNFIQDDILRTKLAGSFQFVFDRGCFHVLPPKYREVYIDNVARLVTPGGLLFLKCFSRQQPAVEHGPYRFNPSEIEALFRVTFDVCSILESAFQGRVSPEPRALFSVLARR